MAELNKNYIAGAWVSGASEIEHRNPSDISELVGLFAQASSSQLDDALDAAVRAQTVCPDRADIAVTGAASGPLALAIEEHRELVDCETFVALSDFAARTFVPSTEASRESGAGAVLTDND